MEDYTKIKWFSLFYRRRFVGFGQWVTLSPIRRTKICYPAGSREPGDVQYDDAVKLDSSPFGAEEDGRLKASIGRRNISGRQLLRIKRQIDSLADNLNYRLYLYTPAERSFVEEAAGRVKDKKAITTAMGRKINEIFEKVKNAGR